MKQSLNKMSEASVALHLEGNQPSVEVSVVVPLLNEAESLPELGAWIREVSVASHLTYEIIFVDDGSTDGSWSVIRQLHAKDENVRGIRFQRNYGKSAALNEGFKAARGRVVITMDADLQDSPDEIPELYQMITGEGYDLVSGWKKKRHDNKLTKNLPSKFFNAFTRRVSGIKLHDFNCGLKAYDFRVVKCIEVYGEMHRYIPVLAQSAGFNKIGEKVVQHQARRYGISKFGWNRFINGFLDLLTVQFISRFGKRPMHFFGLWGSLIFLIGFGVVIYLVFARLLMEGYSLSNRPPFYIALACMILGTMFFLTGFTAELVVRTAPERNVYLIAETLK